MRNAFFLTDTKEAIAGQPPPQKKLHREAKRKIEDKPDERLRSARRVLSAIFMTMPCPQTPEAPKRMVRTSAISHLCMTNLSASQCKILPEQDPAVM